MVFGGAWLFFPGKGKGRRVTSGSERRVRLGREVSRAPLGVKVTYGVPSLLLLPSNVCAVVFYFSGGHGAVQRALRARETAGGFSRQNSQITRLFVPSLPARPDRPSTSTYRYIIHVYSLGYQRPTIRFLSPWKACQVFRAATRALHTYIRTSPTSACLFEGRYPRAMPTFTGLYQFRDESCSGLVPYQDRPAETAA